MKASNLAVLIRLEELKTERLSMEVANVASALEYNSPHYSADHFEELATRIGLLYQEVDYTN